MRATLGLFLLAPGLVGCSLISDDSDAGMYVYDGRPIRPLVSADVIGKPLTQVMQSVSIPAQRQAGPGDAESLVWLQVDRSRLDGNLIHCRETVTASNGVVTNYQRNGC